MKEVRVARHVFAVRFLTRLVVVCDELLPSGRKRSGAKPFIQFVGNILAKEMILRIRLLDRFGLLDKRISEPPGMTLLAVADFLCSSWSYEHVAKPVVVDMQIQYFEALAAGRTVKAYWIRLRDAIRFFHALGLDRILKVVAKIVQVGRP